MISVDSSGRMLALVGSTASGKTDIAVDLAIQFPDVELVSIDSMTIYRRMDIGTAKPSKEILNRIPYHMVDVIDPWEQYSLSEFQKHATEVISDIQNRGHTPLLVGGTGLYFQALVDRISIPGQWPDLRENLERVASTPDGLAGLYARLKSLDPNGASKMEPGNARRIIRALEVTIGSGTPFSKHGPGLFSGRNSDIDVVGIAIPRPELFSRIGSRLEEQLKTGWLDEVRELLTSPLPLSRTARQALGYKELIAVLDDGLELPLAEQQILARTKRFAKRQLAWFNRDPRIRWFESGSQAKEALQVLIEKVIHG